MPVTPPSPDRLEYDVVDVFTSRAFTGNPLAVVFGADDLTTEQLHAIAKEFNLSETTFPIALTGDDKAAGADYRVRIFTPEGEIPFAGHPTLGTAWALCRRGLVSPGQRTQSCGAGMIGVAIPADSTAPLELSAVPRDHARSLSAAETEEVAALVGLGLDDVLAPAQFAGCGLTWTYLHVTAGAVAKARPAVRTLAEAAVDLDGLLDPVDGVTVYALSEPDAAGSLSVSARVFVPGMGIAEDPATGSAAAGLGFALVASGHAADTGVTAYEIEQGVAMGRPSLLRGRVEASDGQATLVHVAGQVVAAATGSIVIPELD